ncbi:TPA: hypothetical protein MAL10_002758 [Klebsiella pneumoniae]|uniref:hypothetical protein n=1 Tax=Klebsiella pneumoniae TaxID=573 RepID=UPI000E2B6F22|nr:Uncharacterised protein [Klebsiella pneumoniae]HBQ5693363.1 hypothetical protein [Klebsiella pneumoniae subsp. pneumoniae]SXI05582.1 Uncharacterised protein [Klebsiella pneumoniae]HBQ5699069.1 hypothetical protein [Klebsiella pneumoniae subsp. pneumoniae]HBQ5750599.1 hypothetical protein [Klebsiella pneumoniae subsp. pneumoniae]
MSEFSRETLLNIIETDHVQCGEASALARMALAAMDSEPVAYIFKHPAGRLFWSLTDEINKDHDDVMPVYAAPQPAPVVPDGVSIFEAAIEECKKCDSIDEHAWNHGVLAVIAKYESCRAAMLNGGKP